MCIRDSYLSYLCKAHQVSDDVFLHFIYIVGNENVLGMQGGHSLENLENREKSGNLERPGKNREKSGSL